MMWSRNVRFTSRSIWRMSGDHRRDFIFISFTRRKITMPQNVWLKLLSLGNILQLYRASNFCHAMLCISAAYAIMGCLCVCVCVCACLSVTFVHSVKTSIHILRLFRPIILVFPYKTGRQYSNGTTLKKALNARGYEKITICDQYRALSQNWCKIEP